MRTKIIKNIFKKEMLDILRDKKTIFMMIVVPMLLYPIMMIIGMQVINMSAKSISQESINLAFSKPPQQELVSILKGDIKEENNDKTIIENTSESSEIIGQLDQKREVNIIKVKDYKKALEDGKIDAYVKIGENKSKLEYKIYINSSKEENSTAINTITDSLDKYRENLVDKRLKKEGLNSKEVLEPLAYEKVDVAKTEEVAGYILGQVLPFMLVIGVLLGAIYPAIDVMAGEKERGTLETLFTLPISNLELVMGKYLAVSLSAIVTAFLNVLSILITMLFMITSSGIPKSIGLGNMDLSSLIFPGIMTVICICLFAMVISAISMCVCSLARSFKDAQNYITPVMLLVMIPSYVSMIPNVELDSVTSIIPVVNISLLIKSLLLFKSNLAIIAMVLISNVAFVIMSVILLSKMFNSEEILFGSSKRFSLLERRSDIKKGSMPGVSDGITLYGFGLVLLIYVGSFIQMKFKMAGLAMTQAMIILLPVLYGLYIKTDFKKLFSIKLPRLTHIIGGLIMWAGGFIAVNIVTQILLYLFPQNLEVVEALNKAILGEQNIFISLVVVAVLPAICEEIFFRGFIYSSFRQNISENNNDKSSRKAYRTVIIFTGLLFGFMHIDFLRIIPTTILGVILTYSVYKSKSIFVPMIIHFTNNAVAILIGAYPDSEIIKKISFIEIDFSNPNIIKILLLLVIIALLIAIGVKIMNIKNKNTEN